MSMSKAQKLGSEKEIADSLFERAAQLWGKERAGELAAVIEQSASNIWRLSQNLPEENEEPGFYF